MVGNVQPGGGGSSMILPLLCLLLSFQDVSAFHVAVTDNNRIIISLEQSDVTNSTSVYVVKITGESKNYFFQFEEFSSSLPAPLVFNATYHGLYYIITLMTINSNMASKPVKSLTVLTKPLPVNKVSIYDYKPSPETGVLFEVQYPEKYNVFTRVNISYWEGQTFRAMLYKDFLKGKTVFNHWLPGVCYSNITLQLLSEASFNKSTLVEYSGIGHEPQRHRTVPYPPRNISIHIVTLNGSSTEEPGGNNSDETLIRPDKLDVVERSAEPMSDNTVGNTSFNWKYYSINDSELEATPPSEWSANETVTLDNEGFVNAIPLDPENTTVSSPLTDTFLSHSSSPHFKVSISWLPPKAATSFDGFNIYIHREGNDTNISTVDENTHGFAIILKEPGKYKLTVASFSSSGPCDIRESNKAKAINFYISPTGEWFEELAEKPKHVKVKLLNSTAALVSWTSSYSEINGTIVSVISQTCAKPKESQRLEKHYCKEVNTTSSIIGNLVPGAQYKVVVYLQKTPLVGPPSDAVTFDIEPTGVKDLVLYPLGPSAVVLSWTRPYHSVFRKYIVEMFYFNPLTMTSEWTPYYEIAATVSLTASVRITGLLPAWYYNFRVSMVTWGNPERSCCDTSVVSFITAPVAPQNVSVEYMNMVVYISWTYGDDTVDLSHSRLLHWQIVADGKKRIKKSVTRKAMTAAMNLPPGDIYNITVTACTERSSNISKPYTIKLEPAPPKSLFAVNKTQTTVTLLWVEEGVSDYFEVFCWYLDSAQNEQEPLRVFSHVVTIGNLQPAKSYNCSVTAVSHLSPSTPAFIAVSTLDVEVNPNVVVISVLALLSIVLIGLLLITLLVLRRKHLQMARECGAGTFVNFATLERDGKLPYNWRRSVFTFLTLLPSCLWTDYLLAFYINPCVTRIFYQRASGVCLEQPCAPRSKNGIKKRKLTNPVQLDDFDGYIKDMAKDTDYKFSLQFEELKMVGVDLPHVAADLPSNKSKNRYTNILPYDFSRVKLISSHEEEGADYINANYIPGYSALREYIATQGPLPETRNDFWAMILQQKSQVIVMLTQCNEKRRIKCDHYWPFTADPVRYGDVTVEMVSEEEQPDWAYRVFRISYADQMHHVKHYNFTAWPDHGVPSACAAESLLQFVQVVRHKAAKSEGPITVHCSAGVGRTGTFISLDRLMQHIRDHEFVDVLGLVAELRSYRMSMVQTEEQFIFIHQCVQLMWKKKKQQFCISDVIYENVSKS